VTTVPLSDYGEQVINGKLSDLDWVSRAALAHEAVIESFGAAAAVLPMKLLTIFSSDERAIDHIRQNYARITAIVKRVAKHHEWGVRVILDSKGRPSGNGRLIRQASGQRRGAEYLTRKKDQRDAAREEARRARSRAQALYDRLSATSRLARQRPSSDPPAGGGLLLLDAAFLVPRSRSASFRTLVERESRALRSDGYAVTLSGPWPPYSFVQD
jgi:hypothetical protein